MSVYSTLLALLEAKPSHGYTLKQEYDRYFSPVKPLPFGQVYSTLGRLQRDGLAKVDRTEEGAGPSRIVYSITSEGVATVDAWLLAPTAPTSHSASTLMAKVMLAARSDRDVKGLLDAQRAIFHDRMRDLTAAYRDSSLADQLAVSFALAHLDADLRWTAETYERLDDSP